MEPDGPKAQADGYYEFGLEIEWAQNNLLGDWAVVQEVFSGQIPEEFKGEHLIQFNYFSSNSCQFLKDGHLLRTQSCPIGNFSCVKNDGSFIKNNRTLEFTAAEEFCSNQTAHLSKAHRRWVPIRDFRVNNPRISASFGTLGEFESFAENMSDVIFWSDFDRINETHFWSKHRNIFIEPDLDSGLGRRNAIELNLNFYRLFLPNVII